MNDIMITAARHLLANAHLKDEDLIVDRFISGDPPFTKPPDKWTSVRITDRKTGKLGESALFRTVEENFLMAACLLIAERTK